MQQFEKWLQDAVSSSGMSEPNAVALATASDAGAPSVRMILLKGVDQHGFVFYTNKHSQKASEMLANPKAALSFFWEGLGRSVRVTGDVEEVAENESEAYFNSRPRSSRIGAWCSVQSSVIESRQVCSGVQAGSAC
jgi:pyridoxamine-phosphate oxidase